LLKRSFLSLTNFFLLLLLLDEAFLAQDQIRKLQSTPKHLMSTLKEHATSCLKPLKHELDPEAGWSDLASLNSTNKEWIHKFIDRHYYLSRLFRKVSIPSPFPSPLSPPTHACSPPMTPVLGR
jgi:hypothetical protein